MWQELLIQFIVSYITAFGFGLLYEVPLKPLLFAGLSGAGSWVITLVLNSYYGVHIFASVTVASYFIGFSGHLFARWLKMPVILFTMPGIIPLVPGGPAYRMMRFFFENQTTAALVEGTEMVLVAGALALGLALNSALFQMLSSKNTWRKGKRYLP